MLWPRSRFVSVAGRRVRIHELRVRDIGEIEDALAAIAGHPFKLDREAISAVMAIPKSDPRRLRAMAGVIRGVADWPPKLGSVSFNRLLATPEGLASYLWVILRRGRPKFKPGSCGRLAAKMTTDEWADLDQVAWGLPSWAEGTASEGPRRPRPMDWFKAVERLSAQGWTMPQIGYMPISQFMAVVGGGERRFRVADLDMGDADSADVDPGPDRE